MEIFDKVVKKRFDEIKESTNEMIQYIILRITLLQKLLMILKMYKRL